MPMKRIQSTVSELHIAPQPGADATSYWLVPSVTQVKSYDEGFSFTPEYVSCDSYSKVGTHAPVKGIGSIKYRINKINGNSTEEAFYTNPIEVLYQYASIDFILYVAGQVVDRKSVSIVNDGEGGTDAVVYWLSPSCTQVKRRADGVAIPESVSCTRYRRIGSNNAHTTEIGSIRYVVTYLDGRVNYECDYINPIVIDSNFASVNLRYYIIDRLVNEVTVPVIDDGLAGPMGQRGMLPYPMGNFDINTTYTATKNIAPFVYYVDGKTYYVMNKEGVSVGINPVTDYANNGQNATWIPFENYKAIYVEMLMARFGLIGKAVFYDEYMFSQHGTDIDGNPSTDYKGFEDGTFTPNLLLNFLTGLFKGNNIEASGKIEAKEDSLIAGMQVKGNSLRGVQAIFGKYTHQITGTASASDQNIILDNIHRQHTYIFSLTNVAVDIPIYLPSAHDMLVKGIEEYSFELTIAVSNSSYGSSVRFRMRDDVRICHNGKDYEMFGIGRGMVLKLLYFSNRYYVTWWSEKIPGV